MFEMSELANVFPGQPRVLVMDDELSKVADAYIHAHGYLALRDIDTPAFMRNYYGETVDLPRHKPISTDIPDPIVDLLRALFKENENDFSFQTA
jgi:hypothetical protein